MSIRRAGSLCTLTVATVLFAIACDDEPATTVSGPSVTRAGASASAGFSVTPTKLRPIVIAGSSCPDPRFVAPFTLGLSGNGLTDLFLLQVDLQFVDRIGVTTPTRSISRAALIERFGSIRIGALETRTFPLEFPLGCTIAPTGTLMITVTVNDSQQREQHTRMTMPVR